MIRCAELKAQITSRDELIYPNESFKFGHIVAMLWNHYPILI